MWSGRFRQPLDPEFERWQRSAPAQLSAADRAAIRALAADLPSVWQAATTTPSRSRAAAESW